MPRKGDACLEGRILDASVRAVERAREGRPHQRAVPAWHNDADSL